MLSSIESIALITGKKTETIGVVDWISGLYSLYVGTISKSIGLVTNFPASLSTNSRPPGGSWWSPKASRIGMK